MQQAISVDISMCLPITRFCYMSVGHTSTLNGFSLWLLHIGYLETMMSTTIIVISRRPQDIQLDGNVHFLDNMSSCKKVANII